MNTEYSQNLPLEWHKVTHVFAALGEPTRQKIIMLFEPGEELAIKDIAGQFDLGRTTIVHHLTVLHANGILGMRRKGRETLYSVAYDAVLESIQKMQLFVEEHIWAEIGAKARSGSALAPEAASGGVLSAGHDNGAANDGRQLNFNANSDYMGFYSNDLDIIEETPLLFVNEDDDSGDLNQP